MNDHDNKKILFNKSTLLSLRAELMKKQEEVHEKKHLPQHRLENHKSFVRSSNKNGIYTTKEYKKSFKDNLKEIDTEEFEACRKSKLALEKKAELYDHLSDRTGSSQLAGQFLVDFDSKKHQETPNRLPTPEPTPDPPDEDKQFNPSEYDDDSEWTEYTDSLGRSRKCLKTELEFYMKRDLELQKAITRDTVTLSKEGENRHEPENKPPEKPFLVQKTHDYLQSLRQKWEEKEKELMGKNKDIHYQDVLYDEARMHGVGYYSFSTDEAERQKQMEELKKQREETLKAQKDAEDARKKREELVAARVAAARARQRARAGLPPEEPKQPEKDFTTCLLEFLTQQKNEADAKAMEKEKIKKEEQEKERQKLRDTYIREWDVGKEGVDEKAKKFREMSQEEYVEQQRSKRVDEFAPMQSTSSSQSTYTFDDKGHTVSNEYINKSWDDVRPKAKIVGVTDESVLCEPKGLFFTSSTKARNKPEVKYRNFVKSDDPTPIVNELSDDEELNVKKKPEKRVSSNHVEIAPPPTFDHYGPASKHARTQKPFDSNVQEAYAQGTKSLESKESNRKIAKNYDFMFE